MATINQKEELLILIFFTLFIGLCGGLIAKKFKIPASFMIGSMLLVGTVSIFFTPLYINHSFKIFAQIISGAYIGQQINRNDLKNLPKLAPAILALLLVFTFNMIILGIIFIFFFEMDPVTAFLSCLPGGIMDVSLISIDMRAQADIVATLQTARLVGMLLILPVWIKFILKHTPHKQISEQPKVFIRPYINRLPKKDIAKNNCLILTVSSIGGLLGLTLGIPVGALIFSLLFSSILKIKKDTPPLSDTIRYIAQICAGSLIGTNFSQESLQQISQLLVPTILLLGSYLFINYIFGKWLYNHKYLDLQSALFASSPAGATDISLLAGELGGNLPKIASIQISRTLYTVIIMPNLVRLILFIFK